MPTKILKEWRTPGAASEWWRVVSQGIPGGEEYTVETRDVDAMGDYAWRTRFVQRDGLAKTDHLPGERMLRPVIIAFCHLLSQVECDFSVSDEA